VLQVGHGIRSRNRVAVGHGISSRSHMERTRAALWCRTGALPALVNKLHQVTLVSKETYTSVKRDLTALVNKLHQVTLTAVQSPGRRINLDLSQAHILKKVLSLECRDFDVSS